MRRYFTALQTSLGKRTMRKSVNERLQTSTRYSDLGVMLVGVVLQSLQRQRRKAEDLDWRIAVTVVTLTNEAYIEVVGSKVHGERTRIRPTQDLKKKGLRIWIQLRVKGAVKARWWTSAWIA